jgi:hypothetical protein
MEKIIEIVKMLVEQGPLFIAAINAVLVALVALFLLIPGDQPEKALKGAADFLAKFSKK